MNSSSRYRVCTPIGNDMSSVMRGYYPSGGITLGPAMTFGYLVGKNLAKKQI
ncbi:FAD-dependent oxidoreductase [Klebsiella pneumoniae]|uniref:FAD-dependent oxidoreductase n=1 Tax=Klebsiella pneumoniae TaxID=573 RepID=A0A377XCN5_KLEPN|nr:FAD-dependent oxidoreductase [Klebsiella pneumoniae]